MQNEILPSGEGRFRNRIRWARLYLVREGLVDSSKRGVWALTEAGRRTALSIDQARSIATKWNRIFGEERRAKAGSSELSQLRPQNPRLRPQVTIATSSFSYLKICRRRGSNDCPRGFFAKPALYKWL
ncbi:winged helix-turn-helix domain-containing protein [Burkholderia sp. MSMB1552]|uniref:winged helix-turn-helix domain-containing protein n=1 Tax=Burkholderia sp. MSMB1552 TaxID=1636424 RepID=UPI003FA49E99